ncbi:MAG: hypothetical protein AAGI63_03555 [Planctomycetota bacterium]
MRHFHASLLPVTFRAILLSAFCCHLPAVIAQEVTLPEELVVEDSLIGVSTSEVSLPEISLTDRSLGEDLATDQPLFVGDLPEEIELLPDDVVIESSEIVLDSPNDLEAPIIVLEQGETIESITEVVDESDEPSVTFDDWLGYNASQSQTTWLADGDFGMFSLQSFPALELGENSAITFGNGFHFLNGPIQPDVRPRLFDFQVAYQMRGKVSDQTMLDLRMGVGAFSDFEGSARKGVRFPSHAVLYHNTAPNHATVFGVDVLDRDDISLLPIVGCIWQPRDDLILELIFPRPKVRFKVSQKKAFYVSGELGGGTWAIERDGGTSDNMTYRDLRVLCGVMNFGKKSKNVLEIGFAFDRELEYRSPVTSPSLDTAFLLRCHTHY